VPPRPHGGWFSYEMRVDAAEPVTLLVTYWGGVWVKCVFGLRMMRAAAAPAKGFDTARILFKPR
jgi:hypothetical protein